MIVLGVVLTVAVLDSTGAADNWGHWRGPTGNGVAPDAAPPTVWSATKNIKWKVALPGRENSSPIVWEHRVFVTTAQVVEAAKDGTLPKLAFKLLCFDRETGRLLWERTATVARPHQGTHSTNGFASASPCTDGERVYAHFGSRGLYCYTLDGEPVWQRDFGKMETLNNFGEGSSPTLADDKILVPWDHQGPSALYALNKRTGEIIWKVDRDEPTCWATPLVVEHAGGKQVVMNGQNFARSYDLETGEELWRCTGQTVRPVASPVFANGIVYVCSGFQGAYMGAFRLDGRGDIKGTQHVVWESKEDQPDMASPLLVSGRLYLHKKKTAVLSCRDAATGKVLMPATRIEGIEDAPVYASPVAAGGYVYLTATNGTTTVIKDAEELTVVSVNPLDEFIGGTPAPVDNELFIRGEKHLFCVAEGK
jgi:outer membrane protein assembly factor BamB